MKGPLGPVPRSQNRCWMGLGSKSFAKPDPVFDRRSERCGTRGSSFDSPAMSPRTGCGKCGRSQVDAEEAPPPRTAPSKLGTCIASPQTKKNYKSTKTTKQQPRKQAE